MSFCLPRGGASLLTALGLSFLSSTRHEHMHIIEEGKEILRTPLECRRMLTLAWTQRTIQQEMHFPDEFIHWG